MGVQAVKGVEIGDGFALAALRGSQAHDEIQPDRRRMTNRAGGIEAGVSNGEEIVVRAAMKPLPTLMKPLASVDLATGEAGTALVERSDVAAVEALAVVAEAAVAWELARAAKEKFGGDSLDDLVAAHAAYLERIYLQKGGGEVAGAFQGRFIFVDDQAIRSASSLNGSRWRVFFDPQRAFMHTATTRSGASICSRRILEHLTTRG